MFRGKFRPLALLLLVVALRAGACPYGELVSLPTSSAARPVTESPALEGFLAEVRSGYPELGSHGAWWTSPRLHPQVQHRIESLIRLSPEQARIALEALKANPPADPRLSRALELALYDPAAWHSYLAEISARALLDDAPVNALIPVIRAMPEGLKRELLASIRKGYSGLNSRNIRLLHFPPLIELRLAPRRAVDALVQHLLKPDELLSAAVSSGKSPARALDDYFRLLSDTVLPESGERGGYGSAELIRVGRAIQKVLRERSAGLGVEDPVVTIAGSFPGGRAHRQSSDLDAQLSDRRLIALFDEMSREANGSLKGGRFAPELVVHAMRETTTEPFAAQINSGFLRITPHSIEYVQYPPLIPLHGDTRMRARDYPAPVVYRLDGRPRAPRRDRTAPEPLGDPLSELRGLASSQYAHLGSPERWWKEPESQPRLDALVEGLASLRPSDRRRALALLRRSPPPSAEMGRILELALFDRDAWHRYFDSFSTEPQPNAALFHALVPVMERMPATLRDELIARARDAYPKAPRRKDRIGIVWYRGLYPIPGRVYDEIAPKRALDIFSLHTLKGNDRLLEELDRGVGVREAYQNYLDLYQRTLLRGLPNGGYDVRDVLAAARAIQQELRRAEQSGITAPSVLMAGSFPNGRAVLETSDIDVMISSPELRSRLPGMTAAVNDALRARHPQVNLEVHTMRPVTTPVNAAIVSPIQILVTPDRIELKVYPRFRRLPEDDYYVPHNYPSPRTVPLTDLSGTSRRAFPVTEPRWPVPLPRYA